MFSSTALHVERRSIYSRNARRSREEQKVQNTKKMRRTVRCLRDSGTGTIAAAEVVSSCLDAIRHGRVTEALPRLNQLKAEHTTVEGVDYARALCFLANGPQRNTFEARQSLLEEVRLHPQHRQAQLLLYELNEQVRPLLLPPAEVQKQHPLFALLCDALLDSTMLAWPRLLQLYKAAERLARSDNGERDRGHIVECGTAGGGSAVLMAVVLAEGEAAVSSAPPSQRRVFALDTFTGMPAPGGDDVLLASSATKEKDVSAASWGTGTCSSSTAHVRRLARAFSVEERLVLLPGNFESSIPDQLLPRAEIQRDGVALLHVDADWYASTRTALGLLVPVMRRGDQAKAQPSPLPLRVVQVDDYHYWQGCRKAVDEYLAKWPLPSSTSVTVGSPPCVEDIDDNAVTFMVPRDMPFSSSTPQRD